MKRLFYILLFFSAALLMLCCPSCKEKDPAPFENTRYPLDCDVTIHTEEGSFSARLYFDDKEARLTLKGDKKTDGITFALDSEGNATVRFNDLTLPVSTERLPDKGALFSLLRLPKDTPLLKSRAELDGERCLLYTLVEGDRNVLFYLDGQGTVKKMVIEQEKPLTVVFES